MGLRTVDRHSGALFPGLSDYGDKFSADGKYRFRLWRVWDKDKPLINYIILNPTNATWDRLDNTILTVQRNCNNLGAGGYIVTNCFALISTDPVVLYTHPDPVGAGNDEHILACAKKADRVVVAWGNHAQHRDRCFRVLELIDVAGKAPECLRKTQNGMPARPLGLPDSLPLQPYSFERT